MSFKDAINAMSGKKKTDKERAEEISIEKRFVTCSGKTTKESATIYAEYDGIFIPDEVVHKSLEFATTVSPTRLFTHHSKSNLIKDKSMRLL